MHTAHLKIKGKPRKKKRAAALALALCLLLFNWLPTPAGAETDKEETVYVKLENDGSVRAVYVVNSLALSGGRVVDYGNYSYVQNLTNTDVLKLERGVVTIDSSGERIRYKGELPDAELPWSFSIRYFLNGRELAPEDLAGQSGIISIQIRSEANPLGSAELFDRLCLQISVTLDSDRCRDISAESGTIATSGGDKTLSFIAVPGRAAQFALTARAENFELPGITIAGVSMSMDIDLDEVDTDDMRELMDGLADLDDGARELLEGVLELYDGTSELADGTAELKDGVSDLSEGVRELSDGVSDLNEGVSEMRDGVTELSDGVTELETGVTELDEGVAELHDGVRDFKGGVFDLCAGALELKRGADELCDGALTITGGAAQLSSGAQAAAVSGRTMQEGFEAYYGGILALANSTLHGIYAQLAANGLDYAQLGLPDEFTRDNYAEALALLSERLPEVPGLDIAGEVNGIYALLSGYDALLSGLDEYVGGIEELSLGAGGLLLGASEYSSGAAEFRDGVLEFYEGSEELCEGAEELADGTAKLYDGTYDLLDGVIELKKGVAEFHDGVIELHDGIIELHDGVIELSDGVIELSDGVIELGDGVIELRDGTGELLDGVFDLKDGTGEIRENTRTLDTDVTDGIRDSIDEMLGEEGALPSFASLLNGEIMSVQFIMLTEGIQLPNAVEYATEEEPALTVWQRFLRLFGVGE